MAIQKIDELDKQILRMVSEDARIPFLEVARTCNVSGAAIHQRIQKLNSLGILKGSQFVIDPEKIGYETCAFIGLNLKGNFDMFIKIYARNNHHLLTMIHDKLQPLGLSGSQTLISFHSAFERQLPVTEFVSGTE